MSRLTDRADRTAAATDRREVRRGAFVPSEAASAHLSHGARPSGGRSEVARVDPVLLNVCSCASTAYGPLAQLAEQRTFNPRVVGSSPTGPTNRLVRRTFRGRRIRDTSGTLSRCCHTTVRTSPHHGCTLPPSDVLVITIYTGACSPSSARTAPHPRLDDPCRRPASSRSASARAGQRSSWRSVPAGQAWLPPSSGRCAAPPSRSPFRAEPDGVTSRRCSGRDDRPRCPGTPHPPTPDLCALRSRKIATSQSGTRSTRIPSFVFGRLINRPWPFTRISVRVDVDQVPLQINVRPG